MSSIRYYMTNFEDLYDVTEIDKAIEALKYYKKGIEHFYNCINFESSYLDSKAIEFMNDSNIKIDNALNLKKK